MIVAHAHLALRAQHARALDAPDHALLELDPGARNDEAGAGEHALHTGARVGRAAHHLHLACAGIDDAHGELVGIGMLPGLDHVTHGERRQLGPAVEHVVDLEAERGQPVGDVVERGIGIEMAAEPRQRELHRVSPPASVGTSSAAKP